MHGRHTPQQTEVRRIVTAAAAVAVAVLASAIVMVPLSNAGEGSGRRSCGVLVDAAHPWQSRTADAPVETGDHWIVARANAGSTCDFARKMVHRLLAVPARIYAEDLTTHLFGGYCLWDRGSIFGSRTETFRPFRSIYCIHLPVHVRHRTFRVLVNAFVDPDPRFISHGGGER